ncbi:hypothetical protein ACLKA6_010334 [Drosophila palustris]
MPKKDVDLRCADGYWPISLLPTFSKLFERMFLRRLLDIDSFHDAIPDHQFGFRNTDSAVEQTHREGIQHPPAAVAKCRKMETLLSQSNVLAVRLAVPLRRRRLKRRHLADNWIFGRSPSGRLLHDAD